MKISIIKFGDVLISRPGGREAALIMLSSFRPSTEGESIELDFSGVKVVAPSWLDEVLTALREKYGVDRVSVLPSVNPSLIESLKVVLPQTSTKEQK